MVICEETGLKYAMPSANKKAEARNRLEIDDETGLKTTIEKTKTITFFGLVSSVVGMYIICGCINAAFFHFITSLV
jgi:hypothetical protein